MKKTFNFQELIKYIEIRRLENCHITTDRGYNYENLGDLLKSIGNNYYDCYILEELNKMEYTVEIEALTFEEALAVYRQDTKTEFEVYINGEKTYKDTMSAIFAGQSRSDCYDLLNNAEFFVA